MTTTSNNDIARAIYLVFKEKDGQPERIKNQKIVKFLNRRRLLSRSADILKRLGKIMDTENDVLTAKLRSAKQLDEGLKIKIASFLKKRYKAEKIFFTESLRSDLLGGIRLEVNDEVIDLTAKNTISKLEEYLMRKA